jgi:uncharacterized protein
VELRYFRDVDGREVDFVVCEKGRPTHLIECKYDDTSVSTSLRYLKERFPETEAWQLHATGEREYVTDRNIRVAPAITFLKDLI